MTGEDRGGAAAAAGWLAAAVMIAAGMELQNLFRYIGILKR